MGAIYHHDVQKYIDNYKLDYYIETGTGEGVCLSHSLNFNFKKFISIEIHEQIFKTNQEKFKNTKNCELFLGNSSDILKQVLPKIDSNALYFLDAHFPGADFGFASYEQEKDNDIRLPLEKELSIIKENHKNYNKSVIIIDDLRIYEDNQYTGGNWKDRNLIGGKNIDFVFKIFNKTHLIERDLRHQGFLILKPLHE